MCQLWRKSSVEKAFPAATQAQAYPQSCNLSTPVMRWEGEMGKSMKFTGEKAWPTM